MLKTTGRDIRDADATDREADRLQARIEAVQAKMVAEIKGESELITDAEVVIEEDCGRFTGRISVTLDTESFFDLDEVANFGGLELEFAGHRCRELGKRALSGWLGE